MSVILTYARRNSVLDKRHPDTLMPEELVPNCLIANGVYPALLIDTVFKKVPLAATFPVETLPEVATNKLDILLFI